MLDIEKEIINIIADEAKELMKKILKKYKTPHDRVVKANHMIRAFAKKYNLAARRDKKNDIVIFYHPSGVIVIDYKRETVKKALLTEVE